MRGNSIQRANMVRRLADAEKIDLSSVKEDRRGAFVDELHRLSDIVCPYVTNQETASVLKGGEPNILSNDVDVHAEGAEDIYVFDGFSRIFRASDFVTIPIRGREDVHAGVDDEVGRAGDDQGRV